MPLYTNFAASRKVNPAGVSPKLTEAQVWKGLGLKARDPRTFINAITRCEVSSDSGDKLVRQVEFAHAPGKILEEVLELYEGTIAYFDMPATGGRITNVLSYDENNDLVLTYTFANGVPGIKEELTAEEMNKRVGSGVEHTIARIRELVVQGEL